jgi:hypothetical protein
VIASTALSDAVAAERAASPDATLIEPESASIAPSRTAIPPAAATSEPPKRVGEETARAVHSPRRSGTLRDMVGIPRSAPPPPKSDAFDLGMLPIPGAAGVPGVAAMPSVPEPLVTGTSPVSPGRDTFPEGLLPASGRTTEPAPPPRAPEPDDDEPELVVGQADASDFGSAPDGGVAHVSLSRAERRRREPAARASLGSPACEARGSASRGELERLDDGARARASERAAARDPGASA